MKRRLVTICVCLLLGAIVNVAVAWGCAFFVVIPANTGVHRGVQTDPNGSKLYVDTSIASGSMVYSIMRDLIPPRDEWELSTDVFSLSNGMYQDEFLLPTYVLKRVSKGKTTVIVLRGWPMHSLWCYSVYSDARSTYADITIRHGAVKVPGLGGKHRRLPLCPLWPGFAINTVFYAAVLWLLLIGPGRLRRYIRGRRGLCPACAYPIGESEVCTECGKLVTRKRLLDNA